MTFLVILAAFFMLLTITFTAVEDYDRVPVFLGCLMASLVLWVLVALMVDWLYYDRQAFAATTACEAKRMEARRQTFSANVVCVPAYRGTKNDTLQVNGIVKP